MHTSNKNIVAIVVTYFADQLKFGALIEKLIEENIRILVIDNTPSNNGYLNTFLQIKHPLVDLTSLGRNIGIAGAQNIGIKIAKSLNASHVIFFDQDSNPETGIISKLLEAEKNLLSKNKNIGALGPSYKNTITNKTSKPVMFLFSRATNQFETSNVVSKCDFLISSGSFIRMQILDEIGLMNEDFFIDGVDLEWILRASSHGYSHYMVKNAKMEHSIGDENSKFCGFTLSKHSDIRNFYKIRNLIYLMLRTPKNLRFKLTMFVKVPAYAITFILSSNNKLLSLKYLTLAIKHGLSGKLGQLTHAI